MIYLALIAVAFIGIMSWALNNKDSMRKDDTQMERLRDIVDKHKESTVTDLVRYQEECERIVKEPMVDNYTRGHAIRTSLLVKRELIKRQQNVY